MMCDIQTLRQFVNARMCAVAEDILNEFVKTVLQYQRQIAQQRKQLELLLLNDVKPQPSDFHRLPEDLEEEEEEKEAPRPSEHWEDERRSSSLSQEKEEDPECHWRQTIATSGHIQPLHNQKDGGQEEETEPPLASSSTEGGQEEETEPPLASSSTEGRITKISSGKKCEEEIVFGAKPAVHFESTLDEHLFSPECSEPCSEAESEEDADEEAAQSRHLKAAKTKSAMTRPGAPRLPPVLSDDDSQTTAGSPVATVGPKSTDDNVDVTESRCCKVCRQTFPDATSLRRHVRLHYNDCGLCGKHLEPGTENLKVHLQVHRTCTACGKAFPTNHSLDKHLRTHTGEKPYTCTICQQRFTESGTLKIHMRGHTGERPFDCKFCGKAFSRQANLNAHVRVHTGEKPFVCALCDKRFCRSQYLKIHLRRHMGEKPFGCAVCAKRFANSETLKGHMRSHTGEKPFVCSLCGKGFSLREGLKVHMTRVHAGEKP